MSYVFLFFACVVFIELFLFLDLRKQAGTMLNRCREAVRTLAASDLSDDEKEAYVRRTSLVMLKATGTFTLKFLLIAAVLYAGYLAALSAFPALEQALLPSLVSPAAIVTLTIAAACYVWARNAVVRQL